LHKEESRSIGWSAVVDPFIAVRKSDIRARVQHLNKISNGDALALGDLQHFNNGAFYKLPVRHGLPVPDGRV